MNAKPASVSSTEKSPVNSVAETKSTAKSISIVGPSDLEGIKMIDAHESGCDTILILLKKEPNKQLGMGIGMRQRGVLVTSLQPNTAAAEKLKVRRSIGCSIKLHISRTTYSQVGDRLLAVNGHEITDQQSAVTTVKSSGPQLVLQVARPKENQQLSGDR